MVENEKLEKTEKEKSLAIEAIRFKEAISKRLNVTGLRARTVDL
jgi:hypothetical protein